MSKVTDYEDATEACPWCGIRPHKPHKDRMWCIRALAREIERAVLRSALAEVEEPAVRRKGRLLPGG